MTDFGKAPHFNSYAPSKPPRLFEEARRDLALFEALNPILQAVNYFKELLEDTQMLAGSEAYAAARLAYNSAKVTGKNRGLDDVMEDLSQQFRKSRRQSSTAQSPVPQSQTA